jgi:hypothetical protein
MVIRLFEELKPRVQNLTMFHADLEASTKNHIVELMKVEKKLCVVTTSALGMVLFLFERMIRKNGKLSRNEYQRSQMGDYLWVPIFRC